MLDTIGHHAIGIHMLFDIIFRLVYGSAAETKTSFTFTFALAREATFTFALWIL